MHWGCAYGIDSDIVMFETFSKYPIFSSLYSSMFGDAREMELHYFLADDTVEICERIQNNSGRDAVPMFLRRQRLPKVFVKN